MTWKRIKRKSLARLQRISSNLDSGPGGENTKQTANHSASLSVSRPLWDKTGVTFPAVSCWGHFLSPKRILGIGADNVTILHLLTSIRGSDTSQVQSNHRNPHTGVNINCRSSDRKSERERRDTEIVSAVSAGQRRQSIFMHTLLSPAVGATWDQPSWNFCTGRWENYLFSHKCKKDKRRSLRLLIGKGPLAGQLPL